MVLDSAVTSGLCQKKKKKDVINFTNLVELQGKSDLPSVVILRYIGLMALTIKYKHQQKWVFGIRIFRDIDIRRLRVDQPK